MARRKKAQTTAVIIAPTRELAGYDEAADVEDQLFKAYRGLSESVHKLRAISKRMRAMNNPPENFCRAAIAVYAMLGIFDSAITQFRFVLGMVSTCNNYDRDNKRKALK